MSFSLCYCAAVLLWFFLLLLLILLWLGTFSPFTEDSFCSWCWLLLLAMRSFSLSSDNFFSLDWGFLLLFLMTFSAVAEVSSSIGAIRPADHTAWGQETYYTIRHTALYWTALHYTALYCTELHCTALFFTVLNCTALHCIVLHCATLHCTTLHCTALHCTVLEMPDCKSWRSCCTHCCCCSFSLIYRERHQKYTALEHWIVARQWSTVQCSKNSTVQCSTVQGKYQSV